MGRLIAVRASVGNEGVSGELFVLSRQPTADREEGEKRKDNAETPSARRLAEEAGVFDERNHYPLTFSRSPKGG
jgi:hypothetical protein